MATAHHTIQWITGPDSRPPTDKIVQAVHVVAYPPNSANATINPSNELEQHLNHWDIILELDDMQKVRFDPVPSPPSMNMTLICTTGACQTDHGALRS